MLFLKKMATTPIPKPTTDIYIGGKQLKQPNPPVTPKWDTEPPDTEQPTGGAKFDIRNAALDDNTSSFPEPAGKTLKGLSGVKRKP